MQNKKGFTLVELLAVIVILGVLIGIAVPSYISIRNNQLDKIYISKIKKIEAAGKLYVQDHPNSNQVNLKDLQSKGYIDDITNPKTKENLEGIILFNCAKRNSKKVCTASFSELNSLFGIIRIKDGNKYFCTIENWNEEKKECKNYTENLWNYELNDSNIIYLISLKDGVTDVTVYPNYKVFDEDEEPKLYKTSFGIRGNSAVTDNSNLINIRFLGPVYLTSGLQLLFRNCINLETVDITNVIYNHVPNLYSTFAGCTKLKQIIGLEKIDTSSITNMELAFYGCENLETLNLSSFNTSNVTNMRFMFSGCSNLKEIKGLESFNTSKVTNFDSIFWDCDNLTSLDLRSFSFESVKSLSLFKKFHFFNTDALTLKVTGTNNDLLNWENAITSNSYTIESKKYCTIDDNNMTSCNATENDYDYIEYKLYQ